MASDQDIKINTLETNYKNMSDKIDNLTQLVKDGFEELRVDIRDNYVRKDSFLPVKAISYGLVGTVMIGFLYAVFNVMNWQ